MTTSPLDDADSSVFNADGYERWALPPTATGWRRWRNRAWHALVCAVLPRSVRWSLNVWTWAEIAERPLGDAYRACLSATDLDEAPLRRPTPVARLWRWGIACPPGTDPWNPALDIWAGDRGLWFGLHDIPDDELRAWAAVWASHPLAAPRRAEALTVMACRLNPSAVDLLLGTGTDPNAADSSGMVPLVAVWNAHARLARRDARSSQTLNGAATLEPLTWDTHRRERTVRLLQTWAALSAAGTIDWEPFLRAPPYSRLGWSRNEWDLLEQSGLPWPPAAVLRVWLYDRLKAHSVSDFFANDDGSIVDHARVCLDRDPAGMGHPSARGRLLAAVLSSCDPDMQAEPLAVTLQRWSALLMPNGVVPPVPKRLVSWGHVVAGAAHVDHFPLELLDRLVAADGGWTSRDRDGLGALDRLEGRTATLIEHATDLASASALIAWVRAQREAQRLGAAWANPAQGREPDLAPNPTHGPTAATGPAARARL